MSLEQRVYTPKLSDDLIPQIQKRLNDFDMVVEILPAFSFTDQTGFLSFKFKFTDTPFDILKDKELTTGFEVYIDNFDLNAEKQKLRPKLSFFDKILGKKPPEVPFASSNIEQRLKDCNKVVTFVWHVVDNFEIRFVSLVSSILAELTNGVSCYPADDIWYENKNIVEEAYKELKEYEQSLSEKNLKFHEFNGWK